MNKTNVVECEWCGTALCGEEIETPRNIDGSSICDDCYHEEYEWTCSHCQNYEHIDHRGSIGQLFVVVDEEECEVPVGTYQVLQHPYWVSDYLSMSLYEFAIKRISAEVPEHIETYGHPMGHLCRECTEKFLLKQKPTDMRGNIAFNNNQETK